MNRLLGTLRLSMAHLHIVGAIIGLASGLILSLLWWTLKDTSGVESTNFDTYIRELSLLQCAQALSLLLWRRSQVACTLIVIAAQVATTFLSGDGYGIRGFGLVFFLILVGYHRSLAYTVGIVVLVVLLDSAAAVVGNTYFGFDLPLSMGIYAMVILVSNLLVALFGAWLQARKRNEKLQQENLQQRHLRNVDKAVAEERQRLAGELHDVAAHHLAAIAIQAAAMRRLIDTDPEAAKEAATQLREQAKLTLAGMRSVVETLREGGSAQGLGDVPALVDSIKDLDVAITLSMPEDQPQLHGQVEAAAYRVVQQGISNALQHAPGSAITVEIEATDKLCITVTNTAPTRQSDLGTGGAGLQLMAEKVAGFGGTLRTTPTAGGGWQLQVTLPLKAQALAEGEEQPSRASTAGDNNETLGLGTLRSRNDSSSPR